MKMKRQFFVETVNHRKRILKRTVLNNKYLLDIMHLNEYVRTYGRV